MKQTTKSEVMQRLGLHYEVDQHNNAAAMASAHAKVQTRGGTVPIPQPQPTPGSELARRELLAMAAKHKGGMR